MKPTFTIFFFIAILSTSARAQWSNTTNQFYDSLDMPVAQAVNDQKNPLVVKSESDGGYFVIWEDFRTAVNNGDIYAQKYDKNGKRLWAVNGVPVATGTDNQQYSVVSNGTVNYVNYLNASHAASDGAGGFYIAWELDRSYHGVCVQHIKNDGTRVFADDGYPLAVSSSVSYTEPQLIADGNGGFFIGYLDRGDNGYNHVMAYCYKDEGGTLKRYGGGPMHDYKKLLSEQAQCGIHTTFDFISYISAESFFIFPDGQGGCGVVMALQTNSQEDFPALNRLARVKKDCHVIKDVWVQKDADAPQKNEFFYKKDTVVTVYQLSTGFQTISCQVLVNNPVPPGQQPIFQTVVYTNYYINNQGFAALKSPVYGVEKINAALLPTEGNIDALLVTWNERNYINSKLTDFATRGRALVIEKYDSVPYQLTSDTQFPELSYNPAGPAGMNKLNDGVYDVDTLIAPSNASYFYDYSLAGSGSKATMVASVNGLSAGSDPSPFYYQELTVARQSADSFAVKINTASNKGIIIGTGTGYDHFLGLAGDGAGNRTFYYVGPQGRAYVKASPIDEGGQLRWGALGARLNSGGVSGSYYYPSSPFLYMDADGKAVVAWGDGRKTTDGYTGTNIYMRHLDSLLTPSYQPPLLKPQPLVNMSSPYYSSAYNYTSQSDPQPINGSSKAWTAFPVEIAGADANSASATPVVLIKDDYDLGTVTVSAYETYNQTNNPIRTNDQGQPYLNRNYTITVTNHPAGANIHVRLLFTKAEFDSLQAHDASIHDPGDLGVIKQPSSSPNAPAVYTPSADDKGITPIGWAAIETTAADGSVSVDGYYIEIVITDFSNFFIAKGQASPLPITLESFTATAAGKTALLQWTTSSETRNDHFNIERSADGKIFGAIGRVNGAGTTTLTESYAFTDATPLNSINYYRLAQVDLDGKTTRSGIRALNFSGIPTVSLNAFPNPARDLLHVTLPEPASQQEIIGLVGMDGHKVLQQRVNPGMAAQDIDISTLAAGTYLLTYGTENIKIVKIR